MFFRLLFSALVVYLGYRFLKGFWEKGKPKEEVGGRRKHEPIDLRDADVEDARFEDVEDEER